jgi:hypothetical protein
MGRVSQLKLSGVNGWRSTLWLMISFAFGLGTGLAPDKLAHHRGQPSYQFAMAAIEPLETILMHALRITVPPLMVSLILTSTVSKESYGETGRTCVPACLLKPRARFAVSLP